MATTGSEDRSSRFTWEPGDLVIGPAEDKGDARTRVRLALGDAAHAMSDEDIDRIIAASTPQ